MFDQLIIKLHFFSTWGLLEACLGRPRRLSGQINLLFTSAFSFGKVYWDLDDKKLQWLQSLGVSLARAQIPWKSTSFTLAKN